jgi:hypothetical protein
LLLGTGLILIGIGFRRFIASKSPRPVPPAARIVSSRLSTIRTIE